MEKKMSKKIAKKASSRSEDGTSGVRYFATYGKKRSQPTLGFNTLEELFDHILTFNRFPIWGVYMIDKHQKVKQVTLPYKKKTTRRRFPVEIEH